MGSVAKSWEEISGKNNWEGQLDPLNVDLRRFVIHCGERTGAIYDAINKEIASEWYGFSQYPPENLFSKVGLQNGNTYKYTVTKFFYACPQVKLPWNEGQNSSWIGYVAVATDEGKAALGRRDILICWRGTMKKSEGITDALFALESASDIFGEGHNPRVHYGFKSFYIAKDSKSTYNKTSAREQVLSEVRKLVDKYKDEEISITVSGHSLGAALATLNATDIVANGYNKPTDMPDKACMVTAIVIASPRVGNQGFKDLVNGFSNLHILRVQNSGDIVVEVPRFWLFQKYVHVGEALNINTLKSPYLKSGHENSSPLMQHDLEIYLHGVAGTQGANDFELVVNRNVSLLNKWQDALLVDYHVPAQWWVEKNKNMVQEDDGSWKLNDYVPVPPDVEKNKITVGEDEATKLNGIVPVPTAINGIVPVPSFLVAAS